MEEKISFTTGECEIEGLMERSSSDRGVVVTHPHPLYGGDMYNYVVESIVKAFQKKEYTTLRFNFRGVGDSRGIHDNGIGEQNDVIAAVTYLKDLGIDQVDLAGYSFGAWVNSHVSEPDVKINRMVMVSPPVGFLSYDEVKTIPSLKLVISGSMDDIAPVKLIKEKTPVWNKDAQFEEIEGADHFYSAHVSVLESVLSDNL